MNSVYLLPAGLDPVDDKLRLSVAAYLARYKGESRLHTESDLRAFVSWCRERGLDPLEARRPHIELYLRWMQEVRRYRPSTVSRRLSVLVGFYRTCVIDAVLEHSPADYVRRPHVPAESPTLGLSHLQFEAMLAAGRDSANPNDFALARVSGQTLRSGVKCGGAVGRVDVVVPMVRSGPCPSRGHVLGSSLLPPSLVSTRTRFAFLVPMTPSGRPHTPGGWVVRPV